MSRSSILVLGSVNTDFVVRGPRLPRPGETVLGGQFFEAAGGKGANQAIAAARLAAEPVTLIAAVGDDRLGHESLARFRAENLHCDYIHTVTGTATGVALILVDEQGENLISVASGANLHLTPADVERIPDTVFAAAKVFLACLESPLATVLRGLERARQHGLRTILNPAPASREIIDQNVLELVDVLTPNEHEASLLTGLALDDRASILIAAKRLQEQGSRAVVLTLGAAGSLVVEAEAHWIPAQAVRAVDTTAAGDAFNGALAVRLAEGATIVEAAHCASAAAALSVTRPGAQPSLPRRDELKGFTMPAPRR